MDAASNMDAEGQGPARDGVPVGTTAPGVYLSPAPYERIVAALRQAVEAMAAPEALPSITVPPVISRDVIERAGYVRSFPQLVGTVHSFRGDRAEWRSLARLIGTGDWHQAQQVTDLILLPAPCYHVYPLLAGLTVTPARQFCVHATCFRDEASAEPGRLRSFRVSDLVYAGPAEECRHWRDAWVESLAGWLRDLGLAAVAEIADDPFFGPGDTLLKDTQREQQLKWELRTELADGVIQAVASCNCHRDHFGSVFGFTAAGQPAHSACVGFGLDRIAIALINKHGPEMTRWPAGVRSTLGLARAG
jgi:hypothetical protein